ncbi:hypothetical protein M5362_28620 [Streptomyces sp. Je 1-79]|uniref:hypothetical protein n=1 Tax=Streptomyces sp. Je 1-79 TaxID=2943847 RepID=UPI0021A962FA|nr:hypothetical protein [Streptomyces sp. Je 1-79]MCT4357085.1 hypothetical protein [Streptomyces sp. Je 1-79]
MAGRTLLSDQIGAMAVTLDSVDDDDRRLLRRLAALVADMIVTKGASPQASMRASTTALATRLARSCVQ